VESLQIIHFFGGTMNDPRWDLAQRIVASPHLSSSPKLIEFFQYVVDCCLRDAPEEATEQQIGIHVFRRIPGYNSSDDSIVRSQARLLRLKLTSYFANEGSSEELIVEIPKGHYLPLFRRANHASPPSPASPEQVFIDSPNALAPTTTSTYSLSPRPAISISIAALICLFFGGLGGFLFGRHLPSAPSRSDEDPFWRPFFAGESPLVIYSNPLFTGTPYTGLRLVPKADLADPRDETYTGTGEATAIYELTRIFDTHHADFTLKRSLLVTWDEAKLRNLVFIGAPSQNKALQELPATSDFAINIDDNNKGYIANRKPYSGEPNRFVPASANDEYAIIASIPGIQADRRIAVFTGLTTNGTQAAVEFACNPENVRQLVDRIGQSSGGIKPFEAVLHIKLSGGVPVQADLVATHPH
jgi:hypothetical protein